MTVPLCDANTLIDAVARLPEPAKTTCGKLLSAAVTGQDRACLRCPCYSLIPQELVPFHLGNCTWHSEDKQSMIASWRACRSNPRRATPASCYKSDDLEKSQSMTDFLIAMPYLVGGGAVLALCIFSVCLMRWLKAFPWQKLCTMSSGTAKSVTNNLIFDITTTRSTHKDSVKLDNPSHKVEITIDTSLPNLLQPTSHTRGISYVVDAGEESSGKTPGTDPSVIVIPRPLRTGSTLGESCENTLTLTKKLSDDPLVPIGQSSDLSIPGMNKTSSVTITIEEMPVPPKPKPALSISHSNTLNVNSTEWSPKRRELSKSFGYLPDLKPKLPLRNAQSTPMDTLIHKSTKTHFEIQENQIERKELIGEGSFGEVWLGKYADMEVAIKVVKRNRKWELRKEAFAKEVDLAVRLSKHQNILRVWGFTFEPLAIVTEYCKNGSIVDYLGSGKTLTVKQKLEILVGTTKGLKFIHSSRVLHRDIAARNILLDSNLLPRICDFGLARALSEDRQCSMVHKTANMNSEGPCKWMSVEALKDGQFSEKSDIWALGVCIWEVFTEKEPYAGLQPLQAAIKVITDGKRPDLDLVPGPPLLKELLRRAWHEDPSERPVLSVIIKILNKLMKVRRCEWLTEPWNEKDFEDIDPIRDKEPRQSCPGLTLGLDVPEDSLPTETIYTNVDSVRVQKDLVKTWPMVADTRRSERTPADPTVARLLEDEKDSNFWTIKNQPLIELTEQTDSEDELALPGSVRSRGTEVDSPGPEECDLATKPGVSSASEDQPPALPMAPPPSVLQGFTIPELSRDTSQARHR